VHGTTLVTNAIIERDGATVGAICAKALPFIIQSVAESRDPVLWIRVDPIHSV